MVGIDITGTHKSTHCNNSTHAAHNGLSCAPPSKQSSIVPATRFRSSVIHADIIHEMSASLVDMHEKVGYIPAFVPTSGYLQHANAYAALSAGSLPLVCSIFLGNSSSLSQYPVFTHQKFGLVTPLLLLRTILMIPSMPQALRSFQLRMGCTTISAIFG